MLFGAALERTLTRRAGIQLAASALWACCLRAAGRDAAPPAGLTSAIPARAPRALSGSQFAELVAGLDGREREEVIRTQLAAGNLPGFLRRLVPVRLRHQGGRGRLEAVIFVMPEYLAIGSDADYLRIPMNLHTAAGIAGRFGFLLPTPKMVDAIYEQARHHLAPQPLPPGPRMASTAYYQRHNALIDGQSQRRGVPSGVLVAGHKKDVVLSNRLAARPGRIAIYGWHRAPGAPIQPLSTVHGAGYADYSHGVRLVAAEVLLDGRLHPLREALRDPALAALLSDEGVVRVPGIG